jgi:hypothetical protein
MAALLDSNGGHPAKIGISYARVSTGGQKLERQLDALSPAACRRVFAEKQSGRDTDRPELTAYLAFLTPGDTLVVPSPTAPTARAAPARLAPSACARIPAVNPATVAASVTMTATARRVTGTVGAALRSDRLSTQVSG